MKPLALFMLVFATTSSVFAQEQDSIKMHYLDQVDVCDTLLKNRVRQMPEIQGAVIYSGKKTEVIHVKSMDADLSTNNTRQIFGKVPGITIWENDGSGIQVGVSARGLSPNRSWEFNVRQNGYDISADMFGYPEAYYNPPMEAVEKIEVVRGAASLAYGPQFGGLLNYVLKRPDPTRRFVFETQRTVGTYGLLDSYNSVSGTFKKWSYFGYYHGRSAEGWRKNSRYHTNSAHAYIKYQPNAALGISLEYTIMNSHAQQAGGLTDALFEQDPQQSLRFRNWFETPWNVAALNINWSPTTNTSLNIKTFGLIAGRNSVGYTKAINVEDTFNLSLNSYNPRQVDRDAYQNMGIEARFLQKYALLNQQSALSVGVRAYQGQTTRKQQGIGSIGEDFDLSISAYQNGKEYARILDLGTQNASVYAENMFAIGSRLRITPGVRLEFINSDISGYINTSSAGVISENTKRRQVLLAGLGSEYKTGKQSNIYANVTQNFRPVTYSELTPSATSDSIDANLKDASGFNIDGGWRGSLGKCLSLDLGGFYLYYNNRIGSVNQGGRVLRTNIGASVSKGAETLLEFDPLCLLNNKDRLGHLRLFVSYAYIHAVYTKWNNPDIANDPTKSIQNKRVEYAPENTIRTGFTYQLKNVSVSAQYNKVSAVYTDAANTEATNATATVGKIPGYELIDASFTWIFLGKYNLKGGVNNLLDARYATRRSGGYPGPGLLPGNGRTFFISVGARL